MRREEGEKEGGTFIILVSSRDQDISEGDGD